MDVTEDDEHRVRTAARGVRTAPLPSCAARFLALIQELENFILVRHRDVRQTRDHRPARRVFALSSSGVATSSRTFRDWTFRGGDASRSKTSSLYTSV